MRFLTGHIRILDMMRPHPKLDGSCYYLMASWRSRRGLGPEYHWAKRSPWKPKPNQTGGWLPGRHRWAGLRPMRRIIEPAVRYTPVTRQANEIRAYKWPEGKKYLYPWDKRMPVRKSATRRRT